MRSNKNNPRVFAGTALAGVVAAAMLYGCQSGQNPPTTQGIAPATQPSGFALFGPPPKKTGVQLWSDNCARCHNIRPPESYSDAQWETIVHEMRLRANLTGQEQRAIVEFLKASN